MLTSVGLNVNAGKNIVASIIEESGAFGGTGVSAPIPSTTLITPTEFIDITTIFGR
jgi:hypothetical protein